MTREELIEICEKAIVAQDKWTDRDTAASIRKAGEVWALLKAGCDFRVITDDNAENNDYNCVSDEKTIWLEITYKGFRYFEGGSTETDTFYLPTRKRLEEVGEGDWY